jgi:hypothetical protein
VVVNGIHSLVDVKRTQHSSPLSFWSLGQDICLHSRRRSLKGIHDPPHLSTFSVIRAKQCTCLYCRLALIRMPLAGKQIGQTITCKYIVV